MIVRSDAHRSRSCADQTAATAHERRSRVFRRLKPLLVLLVSLCALFFPCAAFATQITFSTAQNTALVYTLTAAELASYDPGGFGIYDHGVAGTASGAFAGSRWLVSSGLIGTYDAAAFAVEPSAKAYALWESQSAYADSLGTPKAASTFSTGRTSAGAKISKLPKTTNFVAPYAGFYRDYYFNGDNAALAGATTAVPLATEKILAGWSARTLALAGLAARFGGAVRPSRARFNTAASAATPKF
jgi:hypothetical protein